MSEKEGFTNYVFILSLVSLLTLDYGHAMVICDMCSCICYAQILELRNWYSNNYTWFVFLWMIAIIQYQKRQLLNNEYNCKLIVCKLEL